MSSTAAQIRSRMPRIAEEAFERARLTVVPRRRTRAARMPFVALVSMVLLSGVVGLLLFNTSMQQASFAATDIQNQADTLEARQQSLEMQLAKLRDPQTIALKAQRMGMVLPSSPAVLDLRSGKVLGDPSPATRTDPLRLFGPPPVKPAELDPPAHVTVVDPSAGGQHENSSGNTTRGSHDRTGQAGRNDHTSHTKHNNHSNHSNRH